MSESITRRARQQEDKAARRQHILDTAWALLDQQTVADISVAKVAKEAKLAKGTLYIYFQTKEEIFLAILQDQFNLWLDQLKVQFETGFSLDTFIQSIPNYAINNPKFMALAASSFTTLEANISLDVALAYKTNLGQAIEEVGASLERELPQLTAGQGAHLILVSYALILGMWQIAEPPEVIKQAVASDGLEMFQIDFGERVTPALDALWKGVIT